MTSKEFGKIMNVILAAATIALLSVAYWAGRYPIIRDISTSSLPLILLPLSSATFLTFTFYMWLNKKFKHILDISTIIVFSGIVGSLMFFILIQLAISTNGAFDFSETQTFKTTVVGKRTMSGSKSFRKWYVIVSDWRNLNNTVMLEISKREYKVIAIRAPVIVVTKGGLLGYEWLVTKQI